MRIFFAEKKPCTIALISVSLGTAFLRPLAQVKDHVYIRVSPCGSARFQIETGTVGIVSLNDGSFWAVDFNEEVILCPLALVRV